MMYRVKLIDGDKTYTYKVVEKPRDFIEFNPFNAPFSEEFENFIIQGLNQEQSVKKITFKFLKIINVDDSRYYNHAIYERVE